MSTANEPGRAGRPPKSDSIQEDKELLALRERIAAMEAENDKLKSQMGELLNSSSRVVPVRTSSKGRQWRFALHSDAVAPTKTSPGKPRLPAVGDIVIEACDEAEAKRIYAIHPDIKSANYGSNVEMSDRVVEIKCLDKAERDKELALKYVEANRDVPEGLVTTRELDMLKQEHRISVLKRENELRQMAGLQPATV
jgi:hypothetical protein